MTIGELAVLIGEYGILVAIAAWFLYFANKMFNKLFDKLDKKLEEINETSKQIVRLIKMFDKQYLKILNKLDLIEKKLNDNIGGMKISLNAVILEELNTLQLALFNVIDHNHFKDNINHLNSKIDNAVNKFKTDLHSKVLQMTQDKRIVDIADKNININEDIKKLFIEEIERQETNYDFLKTKVENHLKTTKNNVTDAIYKYYESEK